MAYFHSPRTVTDGLVFFYDTGNSKSYVGEPTTNLLNNSILGLGSGASLGSDGTGTYIQLADTTTGYSRFQLPSIPVSSNDIYTWSFELMSPVDITTGYYFDTNEYSDQFPSSNDLSRVGAVHRVPSTMPAWKWQEFSLTVTMKPDLTGAYTYDFFNMFYPTFQNKKIYYRNMQFEFKDHPTQYVGQGGSRSVTQGLKDLTRNTSIDLTNVSFDSNAQMTFDGTNDRIVLIPNSIYNTNALTIEYWAKLNIDGSRHIILANWTGFAAEVSSNLRPYITWWDGSSQLSTTHNLALTEGEWGHVVSTWDGIDFKTYVNGQLSGTYNSSNITYGVYAREISATTFGGGAVNGQIASLKQYNRALTASEVQQNYNAVKSRFGI